MRLTKLVMVLIIMTVLLIPAIANAGVSVYVNEQKVNFDVEPYVDMEAKRTLVPFRQIFETIGANVWYDQSTNSAMAEKEGLKIQLPLETNKAFVNGNQINMDVASQVVNGRTMVPLRFISENFGFTVTPQGDLSNLTVYITATENQQQQKEDDWAYYFDEDIFGDPDNAYRLFKIKTDGTNKTKVSSNMMFNYEFVGDWIYYMKVTYIEREDGFVQHGELWKMDKNGGQDTKVIADEITDFDVAGDTIFFTTGRNDDFKLYKVGLNGVGKELLCEDKSFDVLAVGQFVYYVNETETGSYLCRINGDGSGKVKISDKSIMYYQKMGLLNNQWIHFVYWNQTENLEKTCFFNVNTSKVFEINAWTNPVDVKDNYAYYISTKYDDQTGNVSYYLNKVDMSNNNIIKLTNEEGIKILKATADYVIYQNKEGNVFSKKL